MNSEDNEHPMKSLFDSRRLTGRLFYLLVAFLAAYGTARALPPVTTTVSDVVYRADGSAASGTLLISWPQFNTSDGKAVAAGTMNLSIASGGAVNVALAPNAGASPAGTFYRVTYKLDDGTSSTEYWTVPATSPTTISAIRSTVVPASMAVQVVSRSYVDGGLALKAADNAVVHKGGDTMTGSLTLSADPSAAMQAATKSYVDTHAGGSVPGQFTVDGATYPNIHSAVVAAGTTGSVLIPANYSGTDTDPNPNKIQIIDLRGKPNRQRGFINMLTDCGLKGDGVTDDAPNANACFALYPGYEFYFPKTQANGTCNYFFGSTLLPTGAGVTIRGGGGGGYIFSPTHLGGTELCFAPGVTGMILDNVGHSATIEDISLSGQSGTTQQGDPLKLNLPPVSTLYTHNISSIQRATNVLTVTVSILGAEGLSAQAGSILSIGGVTGDATMNGTCVVATLSNTSTNPLTFTCAQNGADSGPFGAVGTVSPYTTGTSTADGIRICGNFHTIRHVAVGFFGRHGINGAENESGCLAPFADDVVVRESMFFNNQGFGIFMRGNDANAGHFSGNTLYYNGIWGAYDSSFLGNTWIANQASYNGLGGAAGTTPATQNISAISRTLSGSNSTVSVTTATANTSMKVGSAVVIAGVTDSSFNSPANGAFFVTQVTDSTHYQYIQPGAPANANSSGGTSRMAKFSEALLGAGLDNGAFKVGTSASVWNQAMFSNYVEGGQNCKFGPTVINVGGPNIPSGCVPNNGADFAGMWMQTGVQGFPGSFASNLRMFTENKDNVNGYDLRFRAGINGGTTRSFSFNFYDNSTNTASWSQQVDPTGTTGGSWIIARGSGGGGGVRRLTFFGATSGAITRINSESTGAVQFNNDANAGTGGITVCTGTATPSCPSSPSISSTNDHFANNSTATAFKSATANPAGAGSLRLAKTDAINFRNNANTADLTALAESTDILQVGEAVNGINVPGPANFANVTASGTVSAAAISTGGDSFAGTPRIAWGSFLPGALSTTWTAAQFTLKKAISVVQIDLRAKTAPAGCTTFPVVQITDGTTPINVTMNSAGVAQTVAGGQNYAVNATLLVKVSTAGAGCTTNASDVNVTVQYKMQ